MMLNRRRIDFSAGSIAEGGEDATSREIYDATVRSIQLSGEALSRRTALEEAYDRRIDDIFRATGQRGINPYRAGIGGPGDVLPGVDAGPDAFAAYQSWADQLAAANPDKRGIIRADVPVERDAEALAADAERQEYAVWSRAGGGPGKYLVYGLASLRTAATDPVNLATLPLGPWARVGTGAKAVLWQGVKTGAANAAVETVAQPFVQDWRRDAGLDYGVSQAAMNIAAAGVLGFAADAGIRSGYRGVQRIRGREAVVDDAGGVTGYRPRSAEDALDQAARAAPEGSVLRRAAAGEPDALREAVRATGAEQSPEMRGALRALDREDELAAPDAVSPQEHAYRLPAAERAAAEVSALPPGDALAFRGASGADFAPAPDDRIAAVFAKDPLEFAAEIRSNARILDEGLPWGDNKLRQAALLARLSDDAFDAVAAGEIAPRIGSAIAEHVADSARHLDLAEKIAAKRPASKAEIEGHLSELLSDRPRRRLVVPEARNETSPPARIDDPAGPEAKADLERLRLEHVDDIEAATGVRDPASGEKGSGQRAAGSGETAERGASAEPAVRTPAETRDAIDAAIDEAKRRLPLGVTVKSFAELADLPTERLRAGVAAAEAGGKAVDGVTERGTGNIWLARTALDPEATLDHEVVHALRESGVLTDAELTVLAKKADTVPGLWDRGAYERAYAGMRDRDDALAQEAAAHLYAARRAGASFGKGANAILDKLAEFFERLKNALGGLGFKSADDVMRAIDAGAVGGRATAAGADAGDGLFSLRNLGFRSQLDDVLEAFGQKDKITLATLQQKGVKLSEIEARGLKDALADGKAVAASGLRDVAARNRIEVREKIYGGERAADPQSVDLLMDEDLIDAGFDLPAKWQSYSLDPSNPTYRETVLHLPESERLPADVIVAERDGRWHWDIRGDGIAGGGSEATEQAARAAAEREMRSGALKGLDKNNPKDFRSGHWSEPNVIAHARTSMVHTTEGRPVFHVDELQSDWGQTLRDGGVRDEGKIADLKAALDEAEKDKARVIQAHALQFNISPAAAEEFLRTAAQHPTSIFRKEGRIFADATLRRSEYETAIKSAPGHPLVNTTDQWVNTALRRMIRQAVDADAEFIAIPSGETVIGIGMGGEADGLRYAYDQMYPKNLRNILSKIDPEAAKPQKVDHVLSPAGAPIERSKGHTLFPLTNKLKAKVAGDGQPLFSLRDPAASLRDDARAQLKADLEAAKAAKDARHAAVLERRALIDEGIRKSNERYATTFKDVRGQVDPVKFLSHLIETHGEVELPVGMRSVAGEAKATENLFKARLEELMHEFRPQFGTGKTRQTARLANVVRELAGEGTGDDAAAGLAKALRGVLDDVRQEFNAAGGDIGRLDGWIGPQVHDRSALLRSGKDQWTDDIWRLLDVDRMLKNNADFQTGEPLTRARLREILGDVWEDRASDGAGTQRANASDPFGGVGGDRVGKKMLANQHAEHRFLHFKNADAWLEYQKMYGGGADPLGAWMAYITRMSKDIAALRVLGSNPDRELARLANFAMKQAKLVRSAKVIVDGAVAKVKALQTDLLEAPDRLNEIADREGRILKEIDAIRRKRIGPASERNKKKIGVLQDELWKLHQERETLLRPALRAGSNAIRVPGVEGAKIQEALTAALDELAGIQDADRVLFPKVAEITGRRMERGDFGTVDPEDYARKWIETAEEMWAHYRGAASIPTSNKVARHMQTLRNVGVITRGGSMVLSSIADNFTQIVARDFIGTPKAKVLTDILGQFGKANRREAARAALIGESYLHMFNDGARNAAAYHGAEWSQYLAERTIALQGLGALTDAQRQAFGMSTYAMFADLAKESWEGIGKAHPKLQRLMRRYGLDAQAWDAIRLDAAGKAHDVDFLSGPLIKATLDAQGRGGERIAERYLAMVLQETDFASPTAMLRSRAALTQGTRPGNLIGETARSFTQFKSFTVMFWMLHAERAMREMVASGSWLRGSRYAAEVLAVTTMGAALVVQLKALKRGEDPEPMDTPKFWGRAMLQGGGLGIWGDLLASQTNRFDGGVLTTLSGPVPGMFDTLVGTPVYNLAAAANDKKTRFGRDVAKALPDLVPGTSLWYVNLFWKRHAADALQRQLDPEAEAAFRDRERRRLREYRSGYWWGPGQRRPRAPDFGNALGAR